MKSNEENSFQKLAKLIQNHLEQHPNKSYPTILFLGKNEQNFFAKDEICKELDFLAWFEYVVEVDNESYLEVR